MKLKPVLAFLLMATFSAPLVAQPNPKPVALLGAEALLPQLKRGELILVMRHQRAAMAGKWDDFTKPDGDCAAQRNLSPAGYAGAEETGKAFAVLEITFANVSASPLCRTSDTARLIFGHFVKVGGLGHIADIRKFSSIDAARELRAVVGNYAANLTANTAVVTHGGNIFAAYDQLLSEGDMLFFKAGHGGSVQIIGRATASDFDLLANAELVKQNETKLEVADE